MILQRPRWREHIGIPINLEPKHSRVATEMAARLIIAAGKKDLDALALTGFVGKEVWEEERGIPDPGTLKAIGAEHDRDPGRPCGRSRPDRADAARAADAFGRRGERGADAAPRSRHVQGMAAQQTGEITAGPSETARRAEELDMLARDTVRDQDRPRSGGRRMVGQHDVEIERAQFVQQARRAGKAAVAADCGSVSSVAFFAATAFARAMGNPAEGSVTAVVALVEFAVVISLAIGRWGLRPGTDRLNLGSLLADTLRGRGILPLSGGMPTGYTASDADRKRLAPFCEQLFRGSLMLVLLEMGMTPRVRSAPSRRPAGS